MFTEKDLKQFAEKKISKDKVEAQVKAFKKGFPYADIIAPARPGKGIVTLNDADIKHYITLYDELTEKEKVVKFVPASGAASRMFKNLFACLNNEKDCDADKSFASPYNFFKEIEKFAFYDDLKKYIPEEADETKKRKLILEYLLTEKGLNYGNLPKGLLKFHTYKDAVRTPAEEHLTEGAEYAKSGKNVYIHFTVSPEHKALFEKHLQEALLCFKQQDLNFIIDFSVQKSSTDTIAVDTENMPFRNANGSILFRPGGHGALIENLNDIDADIIFVKNIDNVVPDKLKSDTVNYKKALAGLLAEKRNKIFRYLKQAEKEASEDLILEIKDFLEQELFISLDNSFDAKNNSEKTAYLFKKLNRPLRVCGMVKNEGEPGGGPFFVQKESGSVSLQIVESAQINLNDKEKAKILANSSHFNPVDLVLSVKDYKGQKFDLKDFIDPETAFISVKSKDGKELKSLELPGLWNGAMADWNTVFVEVPISTFNPVKVVNDLLRTQHQ